MVQGAGLFNRLQNAVMVAIVAAVAWGSAAHTARAETYVVALNHAPPYRIIKNTNGNKRYSGFYVDIILEVGRRLNFSLVFKEVPFRRALHLMERGTADIMVGPNRTPEREAYMLYLNEEFTRERKAFFLRPDAPDIAQYEDLAKKRIAVLRGTVYFDRFDQDADLIKEELADYQTALKMVSKGRLATVIMPELLGDYLVGESGMNLKKATLTAEGRPSFIAVSRKSSLAKSKSLLESRLREMKADGTIDRIISRYR